MDVKCRAGVKLSLIEANILGEQKSSGPEAPGFKMLQRNPWGVGVDLCRK